jgi:hypothetical protein
MSEHHSSQSEHSRHTNTHNPSLVFVWAQTGFRESPNTICVKTNTSKYHSSQLGHPHHTNTHNPSLVFVWAQTRFGESPNTICVKTNTTECKKTRLNTTLPNQDTHAIPTPITPHWCSFGHKPGSESLRTRFVSKRTPLSANKHVQTPLFPIGTPTSYQHPQSPTGVHLDTK